MHTIMYQLKNYFIPWVHHSLDHPNAQGFLTPNNVLSLWPWKKMKLKTPLYALYYKIIIARCLRFLLSFYLPYNIWLTIWAWVINVWSTRSVTNSNSIMVVVSLILFLNDCYIWQKRNCICIFCLFSRKLLSSSIYVLWLKRRMSKLKCISSGVLHTLQPINIQIAVYTWGPFMGMRLAREAARLVDLMGKRQRGRQRDGDEYGVGRARGLHGTTHSGHIPLSLFYRLAVHCFPLGQGRPRQ
jgi:hypothetical protein